MSRKLCICCLVCVWVCVNWVIILQEMCVCLRHVQKNTIPHSLLLVLHYKQICVNHVNNRCFSGVSLLWQKAILETFKVCVACVIGFDWLCTFHVMSKGVIYKNNMLGRLRGPKCFNVTE